MASLDYQSPPIVGRLISDTGFIRGIIGPLGSGKSVGCCMALAYNASLQQPDPKDGIRRSRYVIIRNTNRMLADTTIKTVHEWLPPKIAGTWKESTKTFQLKWGDVESEWMFRPMESPEDVRNLLSLEVTGAWLNEYRELHPDVLINLLGRVGRYPPRHGGTGAVLRSIVMDSNPPPVGSYWYDLFEEGIPTEIDEAFRTAMAGAPPAERDRNIISYFRQPGGRAPDAENRENLPEGYYELLVAANAHRGEEWVRVHVDAEYGQDPSNTPVFPEFRMDIHAPKSQLRVNPRRDILLGMDFGRTPAVVAVQHTPEDWWNCLAEFTNRNVDIEEYVDKLIPWLRRTFPEHHYKDMIIYADPAGGHRSQNSSRTCFQVLRAHGFTVLEGPQDPQIRYGSVRRCLTGLTGGRPRLMIDPVLCPMLSKGMAGGYCFAHTREGELMPEPKKNAFSHPNDALQYVLGWHEGSSLKTAGMSQGKHAFKPVVRAPTWKVFG